MSDRAAEPEAVVVAEGDARAARSAKPIRARAYLLAFVLAPLMAVWLVYGEVVLMSTNAAASLIPSVLAVHFLLALTNKAADRVRPGSGLTTAEMVLVYGTTTFAAVLAGFDLLQLLPISLMFPARYGPQTGQEAFTRFARLLPSWYRPTDPSLLQTFFQGNGDPRDPVLWRAWSIPLAFWTFFVAVLLSTMLSLNLIVRERWLHRERLPFPIIELPFTLSEAESRNRLFGSRAFWIGLWATFALLGMNALSTLIPGVPGIRLSLTNVAGGWGPPLSGAAPLYLSWTPFTIGIAFFVPLDVLFSAWLFFVVRKGLEVLGVVLGWREASAGAAPGQFPFVREVAQGAWIGLAIVLLWGARQHFAEVFRLAFPPRGVPVHRTYRVAICGVIGGWLTLSLCFWAAGMRLELALAYFGVFFLSTLVMTRVFAQIGAPVLELYFFNAENLLLAFTGTRTLTALDATLLGQAYWFNHAYRQHPMGQQLAALAMGDRAGLAPRRLVAPLLLAGIISTFVTLATLIACYQVWGAGTAKLNQAQLGVGGWELWSRAAAWQANPKTAPALPLAIMAVSGSLCLGMGRLGEVWVGSPFRPVGFAFAFSYALDYIWNIFVLVWLLKMLLLRYGGLAAYRRATPFFLGIVLGDALAQVVWGIIGAVLGVSGVSPYLSPVW